ncbi:MAG: type II secretion system protein M [Verrucomicrobiaceae bacterium]|nr:type II secretion system protein M [Verrucomicrobiaceae bacterium]
MNTREKKLFIGLLVVLLGGIAYLGFDHLHNWKRRLDAEERKLGVTEAEVTDMMKQETLWKERSAWLAGAEPAYGNRKDAELALIQLVEDSTGRHTVTVTKKQPTEPVDLGDMIAATMLVEAKADLEKMMEWLHDLQKPPAFLSIPTLRLLPDQEDTAKVSISINVQKWFRKNPS